MNLFGTKYKDDSIVLRAEQAIAEDPVLNVPAGLGVSSQKGIVTIQGKVNSAREKDHVEKIVRQALEGGGLHYDQIRNEVALP